MTKPRREIAGEVDALLASHTPDDKVTIVVAWTDNSSEIAPGQKPWRHDLGERPKLVDVIVPQAAVWLKKGTFADVEGAQRFIQREHPAAGRVFTYATKEKDPLARARRDILRG